MSRHGTKDSCCHDEHYPTGTDWPRCMSESDSLTRYTNTPLKTKVYIEVPKEFCVLGENLIQVRCEVCKADGHFHHPILIPGCQFDQSQSSCLI